MEFEHCLHSTIAFLLSFCSGVAFLLSFLLIAFLLSFLLIALVLSSF